MNPKVVRLIQHLLAGTSRGAFQWGPTADEGTYRLIFEKGLVCIYSLGPKTTGESEVGCTVLSAEGVVLHDVQQPRGVGGPLVQLYDLVAEGFQEGAMDNLLSEVARKASEEK